MAPNKCTYHTITTQSQKDLLTGQKITKGNPTPHQIRPTSYADSVSYDKGFFSQAVLQAKKITKYNEINKAEYKTYPQAMASLPIAVYRYNPEEDTGVGNVVWLTTTITNNHWQRPELSDKVIVGKPLWLAFYGFESYIAKTTRDKGWLLSGMFVFKCPYLKSVSGVTTQNTFVLVDLDFIQGKMPYGETLTIQ